MRADVKTWTLETRDGARLNVHDSGGDLKPLVLANGLGGPFAAWRYQVQFFRERYRILSWDYRGLFGSEMPRGSEPRLDIRTHAEDLLDLLNKSGVGSAAFVGWSMGVRVLLELTAIEPGRISHLVAVNGTFARPLESLALPLVSRIAPVVVREAQRFREVGSALLRRATSWPETTLWLRRLGLTSSTIDEEFFGELAAEFGRLNLETLLRTLELEEAFDARDQLTALSIPTLVIVGDRDLFTPREAAERMTELVRNAELLVVRGGTHYAVLEYPELINLRIEKFLRENGY
jgi:pimeloyl-ACP methyl ester carboxylesterase